MEIWERGQDLSHPARAELLLAAAFPQASPAELGGLTLGQRDAVILRLREYTLGPDLTCVSECPQCFGLLETSVEVSSVLAGVDQPPARPQLFHCRGTSFRLRPLTVADLRECSACSDADELRELLWRRCIVSARKNGMSAEPAEVDSETAEELGEAVAAIDPHSEIWLEQQCSECGELFETPLDAVDFFWREIAADARRTTAELQYLSTAYGWSRAKILEMSPARRRLYMEASE